MKPHYLSVAIATGLSIFANTAIAESSSANTTSQSANLDSVEKVTVVANRVPINTKQLAASITIFELAEIQSNLGLNVTDILRSAPSVGVSNSGGLGKNTTLRIRGEEGYRTKLFIDGVELTDPSAPQLSPQFDDILSGQVERIEILRGTQGLAYGADAGGIVSIFTKDAEQGFDAQASVSASRYDTSAVSANFSVGTELGSIYVGASDISSEGFNAKTSDTSNETDGYENTSLHFKAGINLSEKLTATLVVRDVDAQNEYDSCFDNTTFAQIDACESDTQNTTVRAALAYTGVSQSHSLAISKTDVERRFLSNDEFSFANKGSIENIDYLGSFKTEKQHFVFGLDGRKEQIDASGLERNQRGGFFEWISTITDTLSVNLGARYDDNDTFGDHVSYRAGIVRTLNADDVGLFKFKGSYGTGFRAPSLFEQNYNDGAFAFGDAAGLQLKEEKSNGADIGVEFYADAGTIAELVFFKQTIENEIFFGLGFEGYLQNTGESKSEGVELSIEQPVTSHVSFWGNYTFNKAEDSIGDPRLRRPKNKANLGVRGLLLDESLQLDANIRIVRDAKDLGQTDLDDYSITNISASYSFSNHLSFKTGISNVFDKEYEEVIGFNTAGRTFFVGLTVSLR